MGLFDPITDPIERFLLDIKEHGLENTPARRYYALYGGTVTDNKDPQEQGRIKVSVPVLGRNEALDIWAYPAAAFASNNAGLYLPPYEGDKVWVWFDHGAPDQPGQAGGWWLAPQRDAESSWIPEEFKKRDSSVSPTIRGLKVKRGHALLFDEEEEGDPRIELWTGANNGPGEPAEKHHRIYMSDKSGQERIVFDTNGGHSLSMIDNPSGDQSVQLVSSAGHSCIIHDTNGYIEIETIEGRKILISDTGDRMLLETSSCSILMNDTDETLVIESSGAITVRGSGGVNVDAPQTALNETAQEFSKTIQGASVETVLGEYEAKVSGLATMTFLGGLIMSITGSAIIGGALATAGSLTVGAAVAGAVTLGVIGGVFSRLVTEAFIGVFNANVAIHNANVAAYNSHVHPFLGNLGAPGVTSPTPTPQSTVTVADVDTTTTFTTRAN